MALKTTTIDTGRVRGAICGNPLYTVFRGIPYAAATDGANRFAPPRPAEKWDGERLCYDFPDICIQQTMTPGMPFMDFFIKEFYPYNWPQSENSLCLNVWTPAETADEKLPVMVWIHGGGLSTGYGHEMEFDGEAISKRGVILVTINYRVDVLGWFAHPELSKENPSGTSGNIWLLDQIAALEWVQRNISAFGGDPNNVTIFGQSAGGGSVVSHLCSPKSEGLFHKAIIQSGSFGVAGGRGATSLEDAEAWGVRVCEILGKSISELREISGKAAFDAIKYAEENGAGPAPRTVIDGYTLLSEPAVAFAKGLVKNVPVMVGSVKGDAGLFAPRDLSGDELRKHAISSRLGENADGFFSKYPMDAAGTAIADDMERYSATLGDIAVAYGQDKNGHIPSYVYFFEPTIPERNIAPFVADGLAYHSSEMWYIFGVLGRCWRKFDGRHYDLSAAMTDYWTNFAKAGNPNGGSLPRWDSYTADLKSMMRFSEHGAEVKTDDFSNLELFLDYFHSVL